MSFLCLQHYKSPSRLQLSLQLHSTNSQVSCSLSSTKQTFTYQLPQRLLYLDISPGINCSDPLYFALGSSPFMYFTEKYPFVQVRLLSFFSHGPSAAIKGGKLPHAHNSKPPQFNVYIKKWNVQNRFQSTWTECVGSVF